MLAKTGANLILVARTAKKLEAVKNEIGKNLRATVRIFPCDLTKDEEIPTKHPNIQQTTVIEIPDKEFG